MLTICAPLRSAAQLRMQYEGSTGGTGRVGGGGSGADANAADGQGAGGAATLGLAGSGLSGTGTGTGTGIAADATPPGLVEFAPDRFGPLTDAALVESGTWQYAHYYDPAPEARP